MKIHKNTPTTTPAITGTILDDDPSLSLAIAVEDGSIISVEVILDMVTVVVLVIPDIVELIMATSLVVMVVISFMVNPMSLVVMTRSPAVAEITMLASLVTMAMAGIKVVVHIGLLDV